VHVLIVGGSERARQETAAREIAAGTATIPLDAAALPFILPDRLLPPSETPRTIWIEDFHLAFPSRQQRGTRLILTQSTYLLQKLVDQLGDADRIVAAADRGEAERNAPELFFGRGPWRFFELIELHDSFNADHAEHAEKNRQCGSAMSAGSALRSLREAYEHESALERLRVCAALVGEHSTSPAAHLAFASALRENQRDEEARAALNQAERLAPHWEAVAYESGKYWLAHEDMERASIEFRRAADLMPTFSAAFGNLGATLGELGQPEAALAAFTRALANDPDSFTVVNNIGVVNRELGRLDDAIAAFQKVIELAPDFVFGYYNLGRTLFLAGRFADALEAYEEGQQRDREKNRREGCRLALVRFANGDAARAERDLWRFANAAPADEREDLVLEAYEATNALISAHPRLAKHAAFLDRIAEAARARLPR